MDGTLPLQVPFALVYTKLDKRKKNTPPADENIAAFEEAVVGAWEALPPSVQTSSQTGEGKSELLAMISQLRQLFQLNNK